MAHKIYEVGDYSSSNSDEEEKMDSNSDSDIVLSVRRGGNKNSKPVFTAASNVKSADPADANVPITRRAAFTNDYEEEEKEDVMHMKHGGRNHSGNVVPSVANLEAAEAVGLQKSKPKEPEKKKNTTKGMHKGQSLTSEDAVAFMIKERQSLDEEFAAMRRENDKLKQDLKMKQEPTVVEKVVVDPDSKRQAADMERLKRENMELKKKKTEMEALLKSQRPQSASAAAKNKKKPASGRASSSEGSGSSEDSSEPETTAKQKKAQRKSAAVEKPQQLVKTAAPAAASVKKGNKAEASLPLTGKKFNSLPAVLWEGAKLWKVPYNGKGMPEERMIMIKRALRPGPQARPVRVLSRGEESSDGAAAVPVAYIAYPPAIIWYNADKPNESKFAREIVLVEGAYLVDGHQTPAFWKMVNRGTPMPPKELCFSIVTSTRTLDLAAETLREAHAWKNAIHMLLVMITTSKDWGVQNLHRGTPTWHHDSMLKSTAANTKQPKEEENTPPAKPKSGVMKDQMFTATRLNNFSALDDLLRGGVPVNLMEADTADTPLMVACRLNFPVIAKLCLDYGAKNDPHPDFGQTALHAAVAAGSYDCVDVLLDAAAPSGADETISNLPDPRGETPLHTAAMLGHGRIAELLISHGAKLHIPDAEGKNAIHLSSIGGHRGCLAIMLDQGGDELIEARDVDGNTALHLAAEFGHLQVAKLLLETAANPSVRNNKGHTPYAIASAKGHHQVGILLLEYASGSSPAGKRSSNNAQSFYVEPGLGRRAISDTRAQLEQERLRQNAFGLEDDDDSSGGAFTLDVREQERQPQRSQLKRQNSYPNDNSYGLPRPHTSSSVSSPTGGISPRPNGNALMSPLVMDRTLVGDNTRGGMMSARDDYHSGGARYEEAYDRPITARERPAPTLFAGLHVNKTSHSDPYQQQQVERQYSGSPGRNVVNGDRDMAEYYSYVKRNDEQNDLQYQHGASLQQQPFSPPAKSINDYYANPPDMRSPSPHRGMRTPVQQQYGDQYDDQYSSYAEPLEEFNSIGHHWQVFQTDEGYYYYLIKGSEHSQWDDPRTHGYQSYTEQVEEVSAPVVASPLKSQGTPVRQSSIEELGSPTDSFKHPKVVAGKKKPVERVKPVRALKRAPKKIELDVTPTTFTPETGGKPKVSKKYKSRNEYDTYDEDTYESDHSFSTDDFGDTKRDILSGLRQQSSLDELKSSEKNNTDDDDGYIDGEVPEIRLVERKRASPVRLEEKGSEREQPVPPNEYYAEVSGFVRRNLAPLQLGSDDEDEDKASNPNNTSAVSAQTLDIEGIPTLEDNLVVVPSPEKAKKSPSPGRPEKSALTVSTPPQAKGIPRSSPSVDDIKSIDSYWRQSSMNSEKRTPRSRAKMAMASNEGAESGPLGNTGAFESTRNSTNVSRPAYSDEDEDEEGFRKILDGVKKSLTPREAGRYNSCPKGDPVDDDEWDDNKSHHDEGSDWDEDMQKTTRVFQRKVEEVAETVQDTAPEPVMIPALNKNIKLAPIQKPVLNEKELLRHRTFNTEDGSYGNGGNSFDPSLVKKKPDSTADSRSLQKYMDMLYTKSARSIKAQMESSGETEELIQEFLRASEKIDLTSKSSIVNRSNQLKKLASSNDDDMDTPSLVSRSIA